MSNSTIPLSKGFNLGKLEFPVYLSIKYDGVPVRIDVVLEDDQVLAGAQTRQGKPVPSVDQYVQDFVQKLYDNGIRGSMTFLAEVTHDTFTDFKDVSGMVRKQEHSDGFVFNFFDFAHADRPTAPWRARNLTLKTILEGFCMSLGQYHRVFRYVDQVYCGYADDLTEQMVWLLDANPDAEGLVARSDNAAWKPGTRHWDYQKILQEPTIDLEIVGMEQAISKEGEPTGMVGALIAEYKCKHIKIGAGKLSHEERRQLWEMPSDGPLGIAQIKYKKDDSYEALRQPTFQCWRPDKDVADA